MATEAGPSTIANEPSSASHPRPQDRHGEDPDTCRICRGEGTADEPLFYPCKCSGSIKFVHQECLMEWLSHSQKKHCELCKTSFRFTKLYDAGMPNRIPTSVFIRRAAMHVLKMLVTWCRAVLVGSVWLVLLPYSMRVVWRSLFWVGDGGWSRELYMDPTENDTRTSPSQPWHLGTGRTAIESAKAANTSVSLQLPSLLMPFSQTLNMSTGEPTAWTLIKHFFFGIPYTDTDYPSSPEGNSTNLNTTAQTLRSGNPSLLSDISFLNRFPSQAANRFLIDILEGQVITLLVVVAFILIFLIREWVVQQQPVINMVALDEHAGAEREPDPVVHGVGDGEADLEDELPEESERIYDNTTNVVPEDTAGNEDPELPDHSPPTPNLRKRRAVFAMLQESEDIPSDVRHALLEGSAEDIARVIEHMPLEQSVKLKEHLMKFSERIEEGAVWDSEHGASKKRRKVEDIRDQTSTSSSPSYPKRSSSLPQHAEMPAETSDAEPSSSRQRPNMPARDRSFIATEIRRSLEEGKSWSFANARPASSQGSRHITESWEDDEAEIEASQRGNDGAVSDAELDSEHSSESWQQVPDVVVDNTADQAEEAGSSKDKNKSKVWEENLERQSDREAITPEEILAESLARTIGQRQRETDPDNSSIASNDTHSNADVDEGQPLLDEEQPPPEPEPIRPVARPPRGLMDRVLDWLFGDVAPEIQPIEDGANDEHIVQDLDEEAPFVPFAANEPPEPANLPIQDPEVAAAAAQAGIDLNDQDAIDDAEDLEGIMELIGMQGPLASLFQNAMFSAVLISATLACAVWFPYLWGKVILLFMGSPISLLIKLPLRFISALADFVFDGVIIILAGLVFFGAQGLYWTANIITLGTLSQSIAVPVAYITWPARVLAEDAMDRILHLALQSSLIPHPDYFRLSINSHLALRSIQNTTNHAFNQTGTAIATLYGSFATESPSKTAFGVLGQLPIYAQEVFASMFRNAMAVISKIWNFKSWQVTLNWESGLESTTAYTALEQWTATDRLIAILAGYAFFALIGAMYLKRGTPITTSQQGRKIEGIVSDVLQQAGGVLKVILIISIEMLAFPLYCGLLLDIALLPLFQNASLYTRWQFARESPWTFGFVHWFIGTCYMFHFALFVSMCRKIMRKGVLYFIRDPDDPTFHPVRDVLERSVTTQLRKIAFSALVYGGLVIVCLGGVVWGLKQATSGVLPVHWTSRATSLEFPLDLLFYNFLTPFVIRFYRPSDGLHTIYQWWFKACARFLRLSNFLFGDKAKEEEGHHVRRTWASWFYGEKGDPEKPVIGEDRKILAEDRGARVYFLFDGKYVRAPASDQVRIPKGDKVFIEVDQFNQRKDGMSDESGVHNDSELVSMVYIPPWFRVRIAVFVFTIWVFAATTGVGITILPLLFGRYLFSLFLPPTVEMNDIHAFSLGLYALATLAYSFYHLYKYVSPLNRAIPSPFSTLFTVAWTAVKFGLRVMRFSYVWTSLIFIIPFLFAMLLELYFLMPLHAYLAPSAPHVVHVIQDWTLGFLYARLAARIVFSDRASRAARAFSAVIADGYLNPNARLATRCFLVPVIAIFSMAVGIPSAIAWALNRTIWASASPAFKSQVWRFSFPLLGLSLITVWMGREGTILLNRWRMVVKDEVYLIGERLHNFGEKKAPPPPASGTSPVEA